MHQAEQFYCPVSTCERSTRAFPREYNMCDHITRVHKEVDVGHFMKRSRKSSSAASTKKSSKSGRVGATPVSVRVVESVSKRGSTGRSKRDRVEKMERSYDKSLALSKQLMGEIFQGDRSDYKTKEQIRKLRESLAKLEDTLQALNNLEND